MDLSRFGVPGSLLAIAALVVSTAFAAADGSGVVQAEQAVVHDSSIGGHLDEDPTPTPELAILVATKVNVSDDVVEDESASTLADAEVVLTAKNGDIACEDISVSLVDLQHEASAIPALGTSTAIQCSDEIIRTGEAERLELYFPFANDNLSRSGSVLVEYGSGPALAMDVEYRFQPKDRYFLLPLIGAAVLFVSLLALLLFLVNRSPSDELTDDLVSVKGWTFKNSWASNISLVGGISATLLSTTAVFDRLRFISAEQFAAVNLILAGIVLISPLIIGMTARRVKNHDEDVVRVWGFLLSACLSTAAIAGQLGAVLGPIIEANLVVGGKIVFGLIVVIGVIAVLAHGWKLFWSRLNAPRPGAAAEVSWQEFADAVFNGEGLGDITGIDERKEAIVNALVSLGSES